MKKKTVLLILNNNFYGFRTNIQIVTNKPALQVNNTYNIEWKNVVGMCIW